MSKAVLFTDAVIHTGRDEAHTASSMLVKNGRIAALDPAETGNARVVSLDGRHVYPCIIDGHIHLLPTVVTSTGFTVCRIENGAVAPHRLDDVADGLGGNPWPGGVMNQDNCILGIYLRPCGQFLQNAQAIVYRLLSCLAAFAEEQS